MKLDDLTGKRFGALSVVERAPNRSVYEDKNGNILIEILKEVL